MKRHEARALRYNLKDAAALSGRREGNENKTIAVT